MTATIYCHYTKKYSGEGEGRTCCCLLHILHQIYLVILKIKDFKLQIFY